MTDEQKQPAPDPSEVQPTDNSSGAPVDLERLEKEQAEGPAEPDA